MFPHARSFLLSQKTSSLWKVSEKSLSIPLSSGPETSVLYTKLSDIPTNPHQPTSTGQMAADQRVLFALSCKIFKCHLHPSHQWDCELSHSQLLWWTIGCYLATRRLFWCLAGTCLSHCLRSTPRFLHPGVWTDLTLYAKIMIIHTLQKLHIRLLEKW